MKCLLTIIIGAHKRPGLVPLAGDVIPPARCLIILAIPHHLEAVLLRPAVRLVPLPVAVLPGGVVQPGPGALQVLVSSTNKDLFAVEVSIS